ncbi:MAG: NYN domain-containing protein [Clostridiales bacterium]|nr:NYN domain-containing protein [Clostridiales bacterium]
MNEEKRFAVLIDADNISGKYIKQIFDEISNEGLATYKRIYGDWTKPQLASWKDILLANSITPIQQYGYTTGKSSTDCAMIIDAMDILYSGKVDGFCLVSSDSDFTRLASRLRESGMYVVGMGEQKTPAAFRSACHQFKYLDLLAEPVKYSDKEKTEVKTEAKPGNKPEVRRGNNRFKRKDSPLPDVSHILRELKSIINERSNDDGWAFLGEVGGILSKRCPDFDVRNYGFIKLSQFVNSLDELEVEMRPSSDINVSLAYIRLKRV